MSILKRWGLGVDLNFNAGDTEVKLNRMGQHVVALRQAFRSVGQEAGRFAGGMGQVGMVLAPVGLAFAAAVGKASSLAADLEAQKLTMRILIGNAGEAQRLLGMIRENAAATPFAEGDLIEGSKRLLRLTGDNVDKNMSLLKTMELMAALSPGKTVVDATEALLDATSGGGFERMKEFGISMSAEDYAKAGKAGSAGWAEAVSKDLAAKLAKATRGEDLVGALSQTFGGRLSTLGDTFAGPLRDAGERINARLGPLLISLTDRVGAMAPAFLRAVDLIAGGFDRLMTAAGPLMDAMFSWWDGLGEEGQAGIMAAAIALGAFSAVIVPLGGALAALGAVIGGLVTMGGALASAISAVAAPEVLGALAVGAVVVAAALAAMALAAQAAFSALGREGEGPLAFLLRMGEGIRAHLVESFERAQVAWGAFSSGFGKSFAGFGPIVEALRAPLERLIDRFYALQSYFGADGVNTDAWELFGQVLGWVANVLVDKVAAGIELVASVLDVVMTLMQPFQAVIATFVQGLVGLVSGSMSVPEALKTMARAILGIFGALISGIYGLFLGGLEILIRSVVQQLAGIPGMESILSKTGNFGADKLASLRQGLSDAVSDSIAGVDSAEAKRAREAARSSSPTVNVTPAITVAPVVQSSVKVDGKEIARATGGAAVKAGQRSGQDLPPMTRGKVLRGNGTVTGLKPAEVL